MMRRISEHSNGKYNCPAVISYGMAMHKENLMAWAVMPRYGRNLDYICQKMEYKLLPSSIYDIGIAILSTLEAVHSAGYVYNDLKLDNMMVGYNQKIYKKTNGCSMFTQCTMHLIDYGYATKYTDRGGMHV
jgi:serine/threonine protein kinase